MMRLGNRAIFRNFIRLSKTVMKGWKAKSMIDKSDGRFSWCIAQSHTIYIVLFLFEYQASPYTAIDFCL